MFMSKLIAVALFGLLVIMSPCSAMRDPFSISQQQKYECNFQSMDPEDLRFVGAVSSLNRIIGFVENPLGEVCTLKLGQQVGAKKMEVINIFPNEVLLSDGRQYIVIR